jgi:hypothetical protein
MVDDKLRRLAKDAGWFTIHVCRLMDAAYALMEARLLLQDAAGVRERMQDELYASRPAKSLYDAIESRMRTTASRMENMLREYGVDPGRTSEEARLVWSQMTDLSYLVPPTPKAAAEVNGCAAAAVEKG